MRTLEDGISRNRHAVGPPRDLEVVHTTNTSPSTTEGGTHYRRKASKSWRHLQPNHCQPREKNRSGSRTNSTGETKGRASTCHKRSSFHQPQSSARRQTVIKFATLEAQNIGSAFHDKFWHWSHARPNESCEYHPRPAEASPCVL